MQSLTIIAEVADGIGMFGFAVAGLFASAGRRIDPVGVFVSVFTTAFGGGIIRDILLDLRPFYWLSHPQWIWMTLGLTILAPVIVRRVQRFWQRRILLWADAVGLAFFPDFSSNSYLQSLKVSEAQGFRAFLNKHLL